MNIIITNNYKRSNRLFHTQLIIWCDDDANQNLPSVHFRNINPHSPNKRNKLNIRQIMRQMDLSDAHR